MKWYRLYNEVYRDPKVQDLRPELFRFWINVMCIASESEPRGLLPDDAILKRLLCLSLPVVKRYLGELQAAGLLCRESEERAPEERRSDYKGSLSERRSDYKGRPSDRRSDSDPLMPHQWDTRQPESDDVAKRKRHERAKTCVDEHPKLSRDTSQDTSQDTSRDKNVTRAPAPTRARSLDLDLDNTPLPPEGGAVESTPVSIPIQAPPLGPEFTAVGELAIELAVDFSWGSWVSSMGKIGYSAADIKLAIETAAGGGNLKKSYVAGILRDWAAKGGPPASVRPAAPVKGTQSPRPEYYKPEYKLHKALV